MFNAGRSFSTSLSAPEVSTSNFALKQDRDNRAPMSFSLRASPRINPRPRTPEINSGKAYSSSSSRFSTTWLFRMISAGKAGVFQ